MSEQMPQTTEQNTPATASAAVDETSGDDSDDKSKFEVKRRYFAPEQIAVEAQPYVAKVQSTNLPMESTFDPQEGIPEGYGLGVIPQVKRSETGDGNETIGVVLAAIPDPRLVAENEKGQEFIRSAIIDTFMNKVANAYRPREGVTGAVNPPKSLEDFITSRKRGESMKAFTTLAPAFVKVLKNKGLKFMTTTILRQVLMSEQFATALVPGITQDKWESVLDTMVAKSKEQGLDPAVLETWKATRNETGMQEAINDDFSDLDEIEIEA